MRLVEPIKDLDQINKLKEKVKEKSYRDYIILLIGLNSPILLNDILSLKVKDVYGKNIINTVNEESKRKIIFPIKGISEEIDEYIDFYNYKLNEPLFPSRQVDKNGKITNVSRVQVYRSLKQAASEVGIKNFGTLSLRKSFGYHYYMQTKDIEKLQEIYEHRNPETTLEFIGVEEDKDILDLDGFYL